MQTNNLFELGVHITPQECQYFSQEGLDKLVSRRLQYELAHVIAETFPIEVFRQPEVRLADFNPALDGSYYQIGEVHRLRVYIFSPDQLKDFVAKIKDKVLCELESLKGFAPLNKGDHTCIMEPLPLFVERRGELGQYWKCSLCNTVIWEPIIKEDAVCN